MILISSALALGFLHGLGADHLMAIAALSMGPDDVAVSAPARRARALGVAVRFAAGHALLLTLGAGLAVALGWSLPLVVERGGEMLGGLLLVAMGAVSLWGVAAGRVYGHTHTHSGESAPHWHLHIGRRERHPSSDVAQGRPFDVARGGPFDVAQGGLRRAHSHVPTLVGAAFAVSSLRAMTLLAVAPAALPLLLLIALFAVGILLSMSLFGVAFARVMSTAALGRLGRAAAAAMALASVTLGLFWIASA